MKRTKAKPREEEGSTAATPARPRWARRAWSCLIWARASGDPSGSLASPPTYSSRDWQQPRHETRDARHEQARAVAQATTGGRPCAVLPSREGTRGHCATSYLAVERARRPAAAPIRPPAAATAKGTHVADIATAAPDPAPPGPGSAGAAATLELAERAPPDVPDDPARRVAFVVACGHLEAEVVALGWGPLLVGAPPELEE